MCGKFPYFARKLALIDSMDVRVRTDGSRLVERLGHEYFDFAFNKTVMTVMCCPVASSWAIAEQLCSYLCEGFLKKTRRHYESCSRT